MLLTCSVSVHGESSYTWQKEIESNAKARETESNRFLIMFNGSFITGKMKSPFLAHQRKQ